MSRLPDGARRRGARTGAVRRLVLGEAGFAPAVILAGVALVSPLSPSRVRAHSSPPIIAPPGRRVAQAPALDVGALVTADLQAGPGVRRERVALVFQSQGSRGHWLTTQNCCLLTSRPATSTRTQREIMGLIRSVAHAQGLTAIATTHDRALMDIADRVLIISNGQL